MEAPHSGGSPYDIPNAGDAAPWLYLLMVARDAGVGRLWGENSGSNTNAQMDTMFQTGAIAHGYEGACWIRLSSLLAGGSDATYANLATRIAAATG
jgi:hypothetical protein